MIGEIERLLVRLMGDGTHYEKMLKDAESQTQTSIAKIQKMGSALTAGVTAPIAALAGVSVKSFADFDHAMTESTALIRLTSEEIEALRKEALRVGARSKAGPIEAASAYYELFSAGMSAKQAIASLEPIMKFAAAGAFDMATATALAEGALSALGMMSHNTNIQMLNTIRITDNLVRASTLVSGSVKEFGQALVRDAASKMKFFNIDLEEGVAVLAAYHKQQIRGALAGNTFGRMLTLISGAARKHADVWKQVGVAVFDAEGNFRNIADIMEDFERVTAGMSSLERGNLLDKLGIKQLSQKALTPLIGMSKQIREFEKELRAASGTTEEVAQRQLQGFKNQLTITKNQLMVVGIEIGAMLAPALRELNKGLQAAIGWWNELSPSVKKAAVAIGLVAAALGPLLLTIGYIGPALALAFGPGLAMIAPFLPLLLLVGAAILLFVAYAGSVEEAWKLAGEIVGQAWQFARTKVQEFLDWFEPIGKAIASLAAMWWEDFQRRVRQVVQTMMGWWARAQEAIAAGWKAIGGNEINWDEVRDRIVDVLIGVEFALRNFGMVWNTTWLGLKLAAMKAFFELEHQAKFVNEFGNWLMITFAKVFANIANMGIQAFEGLFGNLTLENLTKLIKGDMQFKDLFKDVNASTLVEGLTQGIEDIPKVTAHVPNELEKMWEKEFKESAANLAMTWLEFRAKKLAEFNAGSFSLNPFTDGIAKEAAVAGETARKEFDKAFKRSGEALEAVLFSSAGAMEKVRKYRSMLGLDMFGRKTSKGPVRMIPVNQMGSKPEQKVGDSKTHDLLKELIDTVDDKALDVLPLGL